MSEITLVLICCFSALISILGLLFAIILPKLLKNDFSTLVTNYDLRIGGIAKILSGLQTDVESMEVDNYKKLKKDMSVMSADILAIELKTNELHVAWKTHVSKWAAKMNKIERVQEDLESSGESQVYDDTPPVYPQNNKQPASNVEQPNYNL